MEDLLRFDEALRGGSILPADALATLWQAECLRVDDAIRPAVSQALELGLILGIIEEHHHDPVQAVDFPDAVTNGLRRTTDMVRGVLERTRGDVTVTVRQQGLERALEQARTSGATVALLTASNRSPGAALADIVAAGFDRDIRADRIIAEARREAQAIVDNARVEARRENQSLRRRYSLT